MKVSILVVPIVSLLLIGPAHAEQILLTCGHRKTPNIQSHRFLIDTTTKSISLVAMTSKNEEIKPLKVVQFSEYFLIADWIRGELQTRFTFDRIDGFLEIKFLDKNLHYTCKPRKRLF